MCLTGCAQSQGGYLPTRTPLQLNHIHRNSSSDVLDWLSNRNYPVILSFAVLVLGENVHVLGQHHWAAFVAVFTCLVPRKPIDILANMVTSSSRLYLVAWDLARTSIYSLLCRIGYCLAITATHQSTSSAWHNALRSFPLARFIVLGQDVSVLVKINPFGSLFCRSISDMV